MKGGRLYARHGIPELWVLDQPGDRPVVQREPTPRGYAAVRTLVRGESIAPLGRRDSAGQVTRRAAEQALIWWNYDRASDSY